MTRAADPGQHGHDDVAGEIERLVAAAAAVGSRLVELADGGFVLTRCGHARELPDLRAARAALRLLGAGSGARGGDRGGPES